MISRRGFLRAALLGGGGVVACPLELQESILRRVSYFFFGGVRKSLLSYSDIDTVTVECILPHLHDIVYKASPLLLKARQVGMTEATVNYIESLRGPGSVLMPDNSEVFRRLRSRGMKLDGGMKIVQPLYWR